MPLKSKAQMRFLFAAEKRGEVPSGMAKRWVAETGKGALKSLPKYAPERDSKNLRKLRRAQRKK